MTSLRALPCPVCHVVTGELCRDSSGAVRRNPQNENRPMFHRARVEAIVRQLGLVDKKPEPTQFREARASRVDLVTLAEELGRR